MELKVSYNFEYLKQIFNYILIPVFVVLLVIVIGLFIYSRIEKDHTTEHYTYTMNFWSYLMCLLLSATLFAIAASFVVSLYNDINGRPVDNGKLIFLVYLSPLVPLLFLIVTGYRWIRLFSHRNNISDEKNEDIDYNDEDNNIEVEEEKNQENEFVAFMPPLTDGPMPNALNNNLKEDPVISLLDDAKEEQLDINEMNDDNPREVNQDVKIIDLRDEKEDVDTLKTENNQDDEEIEFLDLDEGEKQ